MEENDIEQPSSFGNPKKKWDVRFYRIGRMVINKFGDIQYYFYVISVMLNLILLIYVGVFVRHSEPYVSDGSFFSCKVPIQKSR